MKKIAYAWSLLTVLFLSACSNATHDLQDGLFAVVETNKGEIVLELYPDKAPLTVANFVTLAQGNNPKVKEEMKGKPFFDGLTFHRVIADFMVQTGDPDGTGSGDAGYTFGDEISDLTHNKAGVLSMANYGPGTNSNSCQFFITHKETPWLDGLHTVFGQLVKGQDVVNEIVQGDAISSVKIVAKGEKAKRFNAVKTFEAEFEKNQQLIAEANDPEKYRAKNEAILNAKVTYLDSIRKLATKTPSGLEFHLTENGNGKQPQVGDAVAMVYTGYFENGIIFDSNDKSEVEKMGKYDRTRDAQGGYQPVSFKYGQQMIPGFTEGIKKMKIGDKAILFVPSHLGYGPQGAGETIPPDTNLIFEVKLVEPNN